MDALHRGEQVRLSRGAVSALANRQAKCSAGTSTRSGGRGFLCCRMLGCSSRPRGTDSRSDPQGRISEQTFYRSKKILGLLRGEGWQVGKHLVYRLYKEEGRALKKRPQERRKAVRHCEERSRPTTPIRLGQWISLPNNWCSAFITADCHFVRRT